MLMDMRTSESNLVAIRIVLVVKDLTSMILFYI
jgi:hypothetical protein